MADASVTYKLTLRESSLIFRALDHYIQHERGVFEGMDARAPDRAKAREREAEARELVSRLRG